MKSPQLSRRNFVKSAALASAPFILPSGIWSAEVKPNDKIAMGFIGMGKQNHGLQNGFMGKENAVCVAVSDCDTTRRNAAKERADNKYKNNSNSFSVRLLD